LFIAWVKRWLNTVSGSSKYDEDAMYAIRCALVHSYGWAEQMNKASIDSYLLMRRQPNKHCLNINQPDKRVYCLNLEDLLADLIFAAHNCIWHLAPNHADGFVNYTRNLIAPKKLDIVGNIVVDGAATSLDFFDKRLSELHLEIERADVVDKLQLLDFCDELDRTKPGEHALHEPRRRTE
jgi:hypothetical protein